MLTDYNYIKNVGYTESNPGVSAYFSPSTLRIISSKITELLMGVDPLNRPIIVPDSTIAKVMSDIYESFRPETSDIHTRYVVSRGTSDSYVQQMIDQVIEVITSDVRNNLGMEQTNRKLSAWTTILGTFNDNLLRSHPPIKIRNRHPTYGQFNMNY